MKTKNITVKIDKKIICHALSLQVNPGDILGILGPNGSGKTTLLHTLAGLHPLQAGEIFLHEKNLHHYSRKEIAKKIAILFQETQFIFPQTVFEFCQSGRHPHKTNTIENDRIVTEALTAMELITFANQKTFTLSGGEKRRLAIATVLAQTPNIYLLDEPTNHLDLRHQMQTLHHFKKISETMNTSIIMTTHDLTLAKRFCNRILMIFENGETFQGNTTDILTDENVNRLYCVGL